MTDIKMEKDRLPMQNGDFILINGIDEVKQHIIVALNTMYTDWILDPTRGIDYAYGLRNTEFLEHDVKSQISQVKGVQSIDDFNLTFDRKTQTVNITAKIKSNYGMIEITETLENS